MCFVFTIKCVFYFYYSIHCRHNINIKPLVLVRNTAIANEIAAVPSGISLELLRRTLQCRYAVH